MPDAKAQTLEKTFKQPFDIERYLTFATEFFKDVRIDSPENESPITAVEFSNVAAGISRVGVYSSPNGETVNILAVRLHRGRSVERARSVQRNFVAREIADHNHDAAIVAFYSDDDDRWRLSYVRLDYKFADGRFTKDLSPAKRYSYLVGKGEPCHTAIKQLLPIFSAEDYSPTLDKIEEAFSVEAVTKDFFELYKERYLDLKEQLEANKEFMKEADRNNFTSEQFAKKLMGQIVFLYFLQKKGWLGVKVIKPSISIDEFDKLKGFSDAAAKIIPTIYARAGDAYELDEKLFKSKDFSDADADLVATAFVASGIEGVQKWGDGSRHYLRDLFDECKDNKNASNFFNDYLEHLFYEALNSKRGASHYYRRFNCRIPFLNGGLFQHEYDWAHTDFGLSDDIFSNDGGKDGEPDGILDIFDRFNFTMNEDEPLEREVAVDPEMLGKIFEELLEVRDRKSKGEFYTPRSVVHYMCQEVLINYLDLNCGLGHDAVSSFVRYGEVMRDRDCAGDALPDRDDMMLPRKITNDTFDNIMTIDRALDDVRIADPAVGSGAFLLGMLNEVVRLKNIITDYLAAMTQDPKDKARIRQDRNTYRLKWDAIKNCIYAVDIEPSAIDIAKLRLWLSLVVDAEIDEQDQSDPKTLPNLDYNIMCGNSLVDEYKGVKPFGMTMLTPIAKKESSTQTLLYGVDVNKYVKELIAAQAEFFAEEDAHRKAERKAQIDALIDKIIVLTFKSEEHDDLADEYERLKKLGNIPFFLWNLEFPRVFQVKGGFDIVIGNPPYVSTKGRDEGDKKTLKDIYGFADDLYYHFIVKGFQLLNADGVISMITADTYFTTLTKTELRKLLLSKDIKSIVHLGHDVFDAAMVSTAIFVATNRDNAHAGIVCLDAKGKHDFALAKPYAVSQDELAGAINQAFFLPNELNLAIHRKLSPIQKGLMDRYGSIIATSREMEKHEAALRLHRESLKPGDWTLIGLVTDAGVGLQTGNNGRYIGYRTDTKEAERAYEMRAIKFRDFCEREGLTLKLPTDELKLWKLFEELKEKYDRDIFGQGFIYRVIPDEMVFDLSKLTDDDKFVGINGDATYVPYEKGDKDGNRWYYETPFLIDWSRDSVTALKKAAGRKGKGSSRFQNSKFYFREGFATATCIRRTYSAR